MINIKLRTQIKVGIDLDNLLIDTNRAWCDLYNFMTGNHLKEENITEWDIKKFVLPQHKELIMDLLNNKLLWNSVQPVIDARRYMQMLYDDENIDLYIVTDTSPQTTEIKMNVLHKFYPFLNLRNHVFITGNKQMINIDILADDGQHNLLGGNYYKILFSYPWNKLFDTRKNGIVRVDNWMELYDEIQRKVEAQRLVEELIY